MGKGRYDAGNAPEEVFLRELEMAEEMPYPDEEPPPAGEVGAEVDPWPPLAAMPGEWLTDATKPPPREYLLSREDGARWKGWLPRGKVAMLAAAGGTGKTMALVQLALCVATGRQWFGYQPQSRDHRRILLALGEEDRDEVWRRLHHAAAELDLAEEDKRRCRERIVPLPLAGVPGVGLTDRDGEPTPALRALQRHLEALGEWDLLIFDPLARFVGPGTETDNALATRAVAALESLVDVPGRPTVLVAHHTSQAALQAGSTDQTASRGVTGLVDGVRWQAVMARVKGDAQLLRLELAKTNYSAKGPPVFLEYGDQGVLRLVSEVDALARIDNAKKAKKAADEAEKAAKEKKEPVKADLTKGGQW